MDATVAILLAVMMCILGVMIAYNAAVIQSSLDDIESQIMESKADFYSLHLLEKMIDSVDLADSQFREDWESQDMRRE